MYITEIIRAGSNGPSNNLIKQVITKLWNDSNYSDTVDYYIQTADVEGDPYKITRSRSYRAWFKDTFEDRVINVYYKIERQIQNGKLTMYREITAPPGWQPDPNRHPGDFWSWDEKSAEAHWGSYDNGEQKWIIVGEAPIASIDWITTLAQNASFDYEEEREIRLKSGSKVQMTNYYAR